MFDLKYFEKEKKQDIYFDELKGKQFSRQYIGNILNNKPTLQKRIDELPDYVDFKSSADIMHSIKGQNGLVLYSKYLHS